MFSVLRFFLWRLCSLCASYSPKQCISQLEGLNCVVAVSVWVNGSYVLWWMGEQIKVYSYLSPTDLCDRLQRSWLGISSGKQMCGGKQIKKHTHTESLVTALPPRSLFYPIHSRTTVQQRTPALNKSLRNHRFLQQQHRLERNPSQTRCAPLAKPCRAHGCKDLTEECAPAG